MHNTNLLLSLLTSFDNNLSTFVHNDSFVHFPDILAVNSEYCTDLSMNASLHQLLLKFANVQNSLAVRIESQKIPFKANYCSWK